MVAECREERRSRSERGKIYEPGDVGQVLPSLSLGFFSVDGWLKKELLLLGQGGKGGGSWIFPIGQRHFLLL